MNKNGLVEKLEAAVINKDKKAFINIIFDFTVDDIIALNDNEFDRILYISNELKIENVDEFFEYLQDEGSFNLDNAMNGVNEFNSILICRFYYELYIHLWMKHDIKFASALSNGGIAYSLLSEMGTNAVFNLKTAMHLFQDAQKIFPQTSTSYASTAMNEGNTRLRLAERGVDTEENLNVAVKLYQDAQKIFPQTSTDYARAVANEGYARRILAERGVDTEENLNAAVKLCQVAQKIFPQTSTSYASAVANEGTARQRLAERGVDTEENLNTAVKLYQIAQKIFPQTSNDYAGTVMNEGIVRQILAERGVKTEDNLKTAVQLCQIAQKIFPQTSTSYASAVMSEGNTRLRLAERGVDTEENLNTAVKLYQDAQKIFPQTSTDYASAVMNEGTARSRLAERGVDTEEKLNTTKNLYTKSILIFENLRDFGGYSIALLNLNRFFINNYRRSGDRKYLDEAKNILEDTEVKIKDREIWDKKLIIAQLHEIRASILEFEGKPGINKASREYSKAHELTGNTFYQFMDEFCQARLDLELFCTIVDKWKEIEKTSIFLDYYDYSRFECHLEKALNNKGLSREEEFGLALKKLEEIRDRTQIKIIKDRVSAHIYLMTAIINCFRRETYEEAGENVMEARKIFRESDDKAGLKICDIFYDAIIEKKDPEAWMEIIRHKDRLSCNIYRLLSEGADRKRTEVGIERLYESNKRIETKLDEVSGTLKDLNTGFGRIKESLEKESSDHNIHHQEIMNKLDAAHQLLKELVIKSQNIGGNEGESIRRFAKQIQQMIENKDLDGLKIFIEEIIKSEKLLSDVIEESTVSKENKEDAKKELKLSISGFKDILSKVKKEINPFSKNVAYNLVASLMAEEIIKYIFPVLSTAIVGIPIPSQVMNSLSNILKNKTNVITPKEIPF